MDSGIGLFQFLVEAELQHYYNPIRNELKLSKVSQLKYVNDEDLAQLGMSRPEQRRLKKYYNKYFSPNYLSKIKKLLGPGKKDDTQTGLTSLTEESLYALQAETSQEPVIRMPNKHVIPSENITINKELGVGEFGIVQQGVWTNDEWGLRIQVAVKCLSRDKMNTNSMEFLKEAAIMHSIEHKSIVRLFGVVLHMDSLMLVTELAPLRSLLECLKEFSLRSSFPVLTLCDFASQICDGMAYLENKRLIHRDLAARNILVFSKNKVKISDFGLSRALGVGKNYYQTNMNVNLKLPIAWCAPECISFLRFTSASDVWAFAVTLWEMFSYGFQPWAGFSGYQILMAIDAPNYQRLEQPECCPQQYYSLMQKCWSHEPTRRPKFSEILNLLPDCQPEQVQVISPCESDTLNKRDQLSYRVGDVITILDKDSSNTQWKGVLNNGHTGYFSPSNVVALDPNSPALTAKQTTSNTFTRSMQEASSSGNSLRNSLLRSNGRFSTKRRLCANMISGPQGDVKHTGHVGVDGVNFGDFPFFEHNLIPKQIVTPYKPSDDLEQTPLIHPNSPSHLTGNNSTNPPANSVELSKIGSDTDNNKHGAGSTSSHFNLNFDAVAKKWPSIKNTAANNNYSKGHNSEVGSDFDVDQELEQPHEYQEIIDGQKTSDFGQSLMEELDSIYNSHTTRSSASTSSNQDHEGTNQRNELTELHSRLNNNSTLTKKKQTLVKPLSADDQIMLDSAIALYNDLSTKSISGIDHKDQPATPTTPNDKESKFFYSSMGEHSGHSTQNHKMNHAVVKPEKRTFSQEVQSVPDIQSILTEESRIAYESLVEQPVRLGTTLVGIRDKQGKSSEDSGKSLLRQDAIDNSHPHSTLSSVNKDHASHESNPLPLPPRDRTIVSQTPRKRHTRIHPLIIQGSSLQRTMNRINLELSNDNTVLSTVQNAQEYLNGNIGAPQPSSSLTVIEKPARNFVKKNIESPQTSHYQNIGMKLLSKEDDCFDTASLKFEAQVENNFSSIDCCDGVTPYLECEPKVFESDSVQKDSVNTKHETKLNLNNVCLDYIDDDDIEEEASNSQKLANIHKHTLPLPPIGDFSRLKIKSDFDGSSLSESKDSGSSYSLEDIKPMARESKEPTVKTRSKSVDDDDAYPVDSQKDSMMARSSPDRVSVEDLLRFADRKPCGRERGTESDEVRIMCKVLNEQVSAEVCLHTLEFVGWDVHHAIKLARLRGTVGGGLHECYVALNACSWDVSRAALLLMGHGDIAQV